MEVAESRRVYIVDDDILIRQSVHFWLSVKGFDPRSFATPLDFLDEVEKLKPGCALVDVRMPVINGIQMLEQHGLRLQHMEIIMMTGHADVGMAVAAIKLGAVDFIEKPFKPEKLIEAIDRAYQNLPNRIDKVRTASLAKSLISSLTPRERDVLKGLSSGFSNKLIAYELNLSVRTIEMHRANVMKKLGVRSQAELVKLALDSESKN